MTESEARRKLENEGYALQVKRNHPDIYHNGCYRIISWNNSIAAGENYDLTLEDVEKFISDGMEKPTVIHPTISKEAIVEKIKDIINNEKVNLTTEKITELFDNISDYDEMFGYAIEQLLDEVNAVNDFWTQVPVTSLYRNIDLELRFWVYDVYKNANPNINEDFIHDVASDDYADISVNLCDGHTYLTTEEWKEILLVAPKK